MLKAVFSIHLEEKIQPGKVAIGKFDGRHPCIVAATLTDKIVLHDPQNRSISTTKDHNGQFYLSKGSTPDVSFLNFNQAVQSLSTGCIKANSLNEVLVVGTPTSLFVYDIVDNTDILYRDIPDGANVVLIGRVGSSKESLALAGGNGALQGFNEKGEDSLWTLTGDTVTAMTLTDFDNDGSNEIIVGSGDNDIRVFKEDAIIHEVSETDAVAALSPIIPFTFGYALKNGTVGVYHRRERLWRIKSKNVAVSLVCFDINNDGVPELVTGWSSGKVDARNVETGEVIFKDTFSSSIAGIILCDYNMDGVEELVVISTSGEVRGYQVFGKTSSNESGIHDLRQEEEIIRELMKKKQAMMAELNNYVENKRVQEMGITEWKPSGEEDSFGAIPSNTQIKTSLVICPDESPPCLQLTLSTSNETIVRSAVIFAEGLFAGESFVIHPSEAEMANEDSEDEGGFTSSASVSLRPPKDVAVDLHLKTLVGYRGSHHFHVFELTRRLPRFSMYAVIPGRVKAVPSSKVSFCVKEKIPRIQEWVTTNFLADVEFPAYDGNTLSVNFLCVRDSSILCILFDQSTGEMIFYTESIELAGQLVQSLVSEFLEISDLDSVSSFPNTVTILKSLISKVEELQSVRTTLVADVADSSTTVRSLIVRAEDGRLLRDWDSVRRIQTDLSAVNRQLLNDYRVREKSHSDLVATLKNINTLIQEAANLRVGKFKTNLIQSCRLAIKQNNLNSLSKIISSNSSGQGS
jgi:Bardet-Biedl syndrome 2 protein